MYELELLELILADKTKDDDQRIVKFKNYIRQLKTENESLRNQTEELEKDNSAWKTQAEKTAEQYQKLAMTRKRLESKIKLIEARDHIKISEPGIIAQEEEPDAVMSAKKKKAIRIDANWIIDYAQNLSYTREQAVVIKDMLMHYYLNDCKAPQADIFELMQKTEKIPQEYDNNHRHEPQPIVHTAAQVVVSNNGKVEYHNKKNNGKHGK
ncbi:MAG: hypothetical protein ACI4EX_04270 [Lachnospiraceae bacterium]